MASAFGLAVGAGLLLARPAMTRLLDLTPITGTNEVAANLSAGVILIFAALYAFVAFSPAGFRPLISAGIATKLAAVLSAWVPYLQGKIGPSLPYLTLPDATFAVLFALYLLKTRGAPAVRRRPVDAR